MQFLEFLKNNQLLVLTALIIVVGVLAIISVIILIRLTNFMNEFAAFNAKFKEKESAPKVKGITDEEVAAIIAVINMFYENTQEGIQPLFRVKSIKKLNRS